jgi:hypothetical protein
MAGKNLWRKLFLFGLLELGAVCGVPLRPDDIERLSRLMNGTVVVEVAGRTDDGDGQPPAGSAKLPM